MPYKHVLAATDFSEMGNRAIARAVPIARDARAALTLLHVIDAPPVPNPLYGHYSIVTDEEGEKRALAKARETLAAQLASAGGSDATLLVRVGDATDEILDCAREAGADLIVLATHGRRGVRRLVLGSVTERVVRLATCSVLVVR